MSEGVAGDQGAGSEGAAPVGQGAGGEGSTSWRDTIGGDYRALADKFETPEALVKSYAEMEAYQGRSIALPGPDAGDEETKAFFDKLSKQKGAQEFLSERYGSQGVPDDPKGYEFTAPEGFEPDEALDGWFRETAHKLKLDGKRAGELYSEWNNLQMEAQKLQAEKAHASREALRKEWGPEYDQNLGAALSVAKRFDDPGAEALTAEALTADPRVARMFMRIAKQTGEHAMVRGDTPVMTSADLHAELSQTNASLLKMRGNQNSAQYQALLRKAESLNRQIDERDQAA